MTTSTASSRDDHASAGEQPLVRIRGLRKSFGLHKVLDGIDVDVPAGTVTVLLGPSGSGKSTLLRCINHLEKPDGGFVEVGGEIIGYRPSPGKLHELSHREIARQRATIGMVFQQFNLFGHMTVLQNVIEGPLVRACSVATPSRGRVNCSRVSAWRAERTPTHGSCRVANSNVSRSLARWR